MRPQKTCLYAFRSLVYGSFSTKGRGKKRQGTLDVPSSTHNSTSTRRSKDTLKTLRLRAPRTLRLRLYGSVKVPKWTSGPPTSDPVLNRRGNTVAGIRRLLMSTRLGIACIKLLSLPTVLRRDTKRSLRNFAPGLLAGCGEGYRGLGRILFFCRARSWRV